MAHHDVRQKKMKKPSTEYEVFEAMSQAGIEKLDDAQIDDFITVLYKTNAPTSHGQTRVLVASSALIHEKQKRLLRAIERNGDRTQKWFMVLAIGSIILSAVQIIIDLSKP